MTVWDLTKAQRLADLHKELTEGSSGSDPPLMLRRLKEDQLPELPNKEVHRLPVAMPSAQARAYEEVVGTGARRGHGILHDSSSAPEDFAAPPASPDSSTATLMRMSRGRHDSRRRSGFSKTWRRGRKRR